MQHIRSTFREQRQSFFSLPMLAESSSRLTDALTQPSVIVNIAEDTLNDEEVNFNDSVVELTSLAPNVAQLVQTCAQHT